MTESDAIEVPLEEPLSIQDTLAEADRLLAGRRTTIATLRPSVRRRIPTARMSTRASATTASRLHHGRRSTTLLRNARRISGLDIDLHDLQHLMRLDAELDRDIERRSLLHKLPPADPQRCEDVMRQMRLITCIAALGGFLSGYNTGVLSGALLPLARVFHLSSMHKELIVSATIIAAFQGSFRGGALNYKYGRRKSILLAAAVFVVGAMILFAAMNYSTLVIGEVLLGIGIGIESLTSPMYIAEMAKPSLRGMLVSAYALMMCFGQFFAGMVDGLLAPFHYGWRFMLGIAAFPACIMFVGFWNLPESPSWLLSKNQAEEAEKILRTLRDTDEDVQEELWEIRESLEMTGGDNEDEEASSTMFLEMWKNKPTRRALVVGCSLMVLQQWCGVNSVLYYAASIYQMAGFSEVVSIWLSAFTSLAQIMGLTMSVLLVETAGRRILLLSSMALVTLSLVGLGFSFYLARVDSELVVSSLDEECASQRAWGWNGATTYCFDCVSIGSCGFCGTGVCVRGTEEGPFDPDQCPADASYNNTSCSNPYAYLSVLFMVIFLIVFGIGLAGLPWTVNSEIYPIKYRSLAVSLSTSTNWLCNLMISASFLTLSERLMTHRALWLYAILSGCGLVWLYLALPETRGKTLEDLNEVFGGEAHMHEDRTLLTAIEEKNSERSSYGSVSNG